ncbi:MAG: SUMF1/EgtB/PvdO family nonheme iron enzyme [Rubrivivax sp.]
MATVYLSSTFQDLAVHRDAVYRLLRKAGYEVVAMEDYVACDDRPLHRCVADVRRADVYVGLFAFRYGHVPPREQGNPDGLSITELEFRAAEAASKPRLCFVVKEGTSWNTAFIDAMASGGDASRINRLREHLLTNRLASEFGSPDELAGLVVASVAAHLNRAAAPTLPQPLQPAWDIDRDHSPYPGLEHFRPTHSPVYFGRAAEVADVLARLADPALRFVLVSGDSGVGKSSLVHAGVLPALKLQAAPQALHVARMIPSNGEHAFAALTNALAAVPALERHLGTPFALGQKWRAEPDCMPDDLRRRLSAVRPEGDLVLFVDQMEELFAPSQDVVAQAAVAPFLATLFRAASMPGVGLRVVATLRSDHLHHCHHHESLRTLLSSRSHMALGPAEDWQLRDMIERPALSAGLEIAPRLADRLLREAGQGPGRLPLLAFALRQLFDGRKGHVLTEQAYEAFGGISGAIARQAAAADAGLALDGLRTLFPRLVRVDGEGHATRQRVRLQALPAAERDAIEHLVRHRLLSIEGEGQQAAASVAHERLFSAWPALARWIDEHQGELRLVRNAEQEAQDWVRQGHAIDFLWSAPKLQALRRAMSKVQATTGSAALEAFAQPQAALVHRLLRPELTHRERFATGQMLGELGDPRPGIGLGPDGLPHIDWVPVSPGVVELEEGGGRFEVTEAFEIARYPVTNQQFQAFVQSENGWQNERWWRGLRRPEAPTAPTWPEPNCPATDLDWYEAMAFTRWLTARQAEVGHDRRACRLPTEWEWQLAATGGNPALGYPWGDWDPMHANSLASGLRRTSAVGLYPYGCRSDQPHDMAGNVWEWCFNRHDEPESMARSTPSRSHQPAGMADSTPNGYVALYLASRSSPASVHDESAASRVLRGGSWNSNARFLRADFRYHLLPVGRNNGIGFRLCRSTHVDTGHPGA